MDKISEIFISLDTHHVSLKVFFGFAFMSMITYRMDEADSLILIPLLCLMMTSLGFTLLLVLISIFLFSWYWRQKNHISHAAFWQERSHTNDANTRTSNPSSFTTITHQDIKDGKYFPVDKGLMVRFTVAFICFFLSNQFNDLHVYQRLTTAAAVCHNCTVYSFMRSAPYRNTAYSTQHRWRLGAVSHT